MQRIESLANFNVVSELNQSQDQNSHIKNPLYNTYIISDLCNLSYKNSMIHQVKDHKLNIATYDVQNIYNMYHFHT